MKAFRLIDAERARFPVSMLCGMLGVFKSGYYAWGKRTLFRNYRRGVTGT